MGEAMGRQNVGVEVEVVKSVVPIGARVGNPISGGIGRCGEDGFDEKSHLLMGLMQGEGSRGEIVRSI
ncbi:hypothetical protein P8452_52773 [Trifolium repens]|nr:hypothetical protein P8452_52773 [Trifolium repens]